MGRRGCSRPVVAASWLTTREASRGKRWTMNLHEDGGRGRVARGPPPSCTGAATELHGGRHRAAQMVHMRPWPETATRRRELILGDSGGRGVAQGRDELGSDTGYMGPWPMKMWSGSHTSRRLGVEKNLAGRHRLTESCTMEWAHSKGAEDLRRGEVGGLARGSPARSGRGKRAVEVDPAFAWLMCWVLRGSAAQVPRGSRIRRCWLCVGGGAPALIWREAEEQGRGRSHAGVGRGG